MKNIVKYAENKLINNKDKLAEIIDKIFTSPFRLVFILIIAIFFTTFIITTPYYHTNDDAMMRVFAEGSFNPWIGPSNFLLYSNSIYGKLLQLFYRWQPNIYWYDLISYTLQFCALGVTAFTLFDKKNKIFNLFTLITLYFVYAPLFVSMQFTTRTGILAVAAISICIYMLKNKLKYYNYILLSIVAFSFIIIASLTRGNASYITLLYGCVISLLLVRKNDYKKLILIILTVVLGLGVSLGLEQLSIHYAKKCEVTNNSYQLNQQLQRLFNNTIAGEYMGNYAWIPVEKKVKNLDKKLARIGWTKGDYRLYLAWLDIGNKDLFSIDKLKKAADVLEDDISLSKTFKVKFDVENFYLFKIYSIIGLISLILFFSPKKMKKPLIIVASVFILEILLNIKFRTTPARLWLNFTLTMLIVLYSYIKYYSQYFIVNKVFEKFNIESDNTKYKFISILIIMLLYCSYSLTPLRLFKNYSHANKKTYKTLISNLQNAKKDKIYILNQDILLSCARPFKKSIYDYKYKFLFGLNESPQAKDLIKRYNFPETNTWDNVCSDNKVEFFSTINPHINASLFLQTQIAIKSHMKDRYNKEVVFIEKQNLGNLKTYSCEVMTKEDLELAKRIQKAKTYNDLNYFERSLQ